MNVSVKNIRQEESTVIITVDMPDDIMNELGEPFVDFDIYLHVDAIGSRMLLYSLPTPQEALESIVREHVRRVNPDLPDATNREELVAIQLEDVEAISVDMHCKKKLDKICVTNIKQIEDAMTHRLVGG